MIMASVNPKNIFRNAKQVVDDLLIWRYKASRKYPRIQILCAEEIRQHPCVNPKKENPRNNLVERFGMSTLFPSPNVLIYLYCEEARRGFH